MLRVCYLSLVSGPHHSGGPGPQQWHRRPGKSSAPWISASPGSSVQPCQARPCPFGLCQLPGEWLPNFYHSWFPTTSTRFATAQQPTGAKTKVGPGNAFLLPEHVTGPHGLREAPECQFHAQEVEERQLVHGTSSRAGLTRWLSGSLPVSRRDVPSAPAHGPLAQCPLLFLVSAEGSPSGNAFSEPSPGQGQGAPCAPTPVSPPSQCFLMWERATPWSRILGPESS